jgi:hypothetical protein
MSGPPMEVVLRRAQIRHIAVRIPSMGLSAVCKEATFPEFSGQESGLWREISGFWRRRPQIGRRVSARRFFNNRNLDMEALRDRLRFRGDRFETGFHNWVGKSGATWSSSSVGRAVTRARTRSVRSSGSLAGTIGTSKLNGWMSLDLSSKLLVKGDFDVQRPDVSATRSPVAGGAVSAPSVGVSWLPHQVVGRYASMRAGWPAGR